MSQEECKSLLEILKRHKTQPKSQTPINNPAIETILFSIQQLEAEINSVAAYNQPVDAEKEASLKEP